MHILVANKAILLFELFTLASLAYFYVARNGLHLSYDDRFSYFKVLWTF